MQLHVSYTLSCLILTTCVKYVFSSKFTLSMITLTCIEIVLSFHDVLASKFTPSMITLITCKYIYKNVVFSGGQYGVRHSRNYLKFSNDVFGCQIASNNVF